MDELVSLKQLFMFEILPTLAADVALTGVFRLLVVHHRRRMVQNLIAHLLTLYMLQ